MPSQTLRVKRHALERVYRTRMLNLRTLKQSYNNSRKDLAAVINCTPAFITHICGENPIRTIGEKLARDIEQKCGLSPGWLDITR